MVIHLSLFQQNNKYPMYNYRVLNLDDKRKTMKKQKTVIVEEAKKTLK